jgi:hypothetical protein
MVRSMVGFMSSCNLHKTSDRPLVAPATECSNHLRGPKMKTLFK